MKAVTIPLEDRRAERAQRMEAVTQALAAVSLVSAALGALPAPDTEGTLLAGFELLAAALLVGAVVRELRATRGGAEEGPARVPRIGWVNLFAAAALFAETYHRVYTGGKFSRPTFLLGVIALALALLHPWIARRRAGMRFFRADDAGIELRTSPLRGFRLGWDEIAGVERDGDTLLVRTRAGAVRRVALRRYRNGEALAATLLEAAAARAIPGAGPVLPAPPLGAV
ncbi:MAG TPA: hypothetical protein VGV85_16595 [Longimicrobiaceae bacterium]|nr:hypothetical protein [Longimicrobiaceae bacterium]